MTAPPLTPDDLPDVPLPAGFRWALSPYSGRVCIYWGDDPARRRLVAEAGLNFWNGYETKVGMHRRVYMRRCFGDLSRAFCFLAAWLHARHEAVAEELAGRRSDPTERLDPYVRDWRDVRKPKAQPRANPFRTPPPQSGTSREARRRW
ncbi:hypothetical protein [Lysobacter sp. HA35]